MRHFVVVVVVALLLFVPAFASAQSWGVEVRTGKAGVSLDAVCRKLTENNPFSGKKISREVAMSLGKDLVAVFSIPWMVRENDYRKSEGQGLCLDGKVAFYNGNTVMDALVRVLESGGVHPKDIGQTPTSLRQLLLKDLKAGIAEVRRLFKEGYGSLSDFYEPYLNDLAGVGMKQWHFTAQELGLIDEEKKMMAGR